MSNAGSLRQRERAHGFWTVTAHPGVIDTAAAAGPDFVCIDTQHGVDLASLDVSSFTTMARYGVPGLVRVDGIDPARIGRALDLGASGVVIPLVESADDAHRAVAACRYAPDGVRSWGVQTRGVDPLGDTPLCWIQIETAAAMEHLHEIAAVDGVDALYVGPADLGLALCGQPASDVESVFDGTHPKAAEMKSAFEAVVDACDKTGKTPGLHCASGRAAVIAARHGFRLSAVAADLALLAETLEAELNRARSATD